MSHYRIASVCCGLLIVCAMGCGASTAAETAVSLTGVTPLQRTGDVSVDKGPAGEPLDLGDIVYATGLGVKAGSELTYDVSGRSGRFEAWVGIDPKVSAKRSGRFRVYADRNLVFDSGVINQTDKRGSSQNPTRPTRVVVPTELWKKRSLGEHDKLLKFEAVPSHGVVFVQLAK